jgi:hypothetical protein
MKNFQILSAVCRQPSVWAGDGRVRLLLVLGCSLLAIAFATAQTTNNSTKTDYSSYSSYIAERNIFNPTRYARSTRNYQGPRTTVSRQRPSFSLAGIMSYEHGETPGVYAFFDGTSSDFRKTLQRDGTIANFKVVSITADAVTLAQDTNQFVLKVGMSLRQENAGRWILADASSTFARSSSSDESGRNGRWNRQQRSSGNDRNDRNGFNNFNNSSAGPGEMTPPPDNTDTNAMDTAEGEMTNDQAETPADQTGAVTDNPPQTISVPAGPAGDALQRLMQLRQQEEQRTGGQ